MPRSPAPCLTGMEFRRTRTICCNQGPKVRERIHLLQLLILNEYAAHYAVARHYLGLVNVDYYCTSKFQMY